MLVSVKQKNVLETETYANEAQTGVGFRSTEKCIRNGNTCKRGTNGCWFPLNRKMYQKRKHMQTRHKRVLVSVKQKNVLETETYANEAQTGVGFR